MTLGDFIFYLVLTGLMAAPVVQIASIGTQISEAFAGLDRIRELMEMDTEDEEDSGKAPLGTLDGEVELRARGLRVQRRRAGAEGRQLQRAGRARRPRSSGRADRARARSSAW